MGAMASHSDSTSCHAAARARRGDAGGSVASSGSACGSMSRTYTAPKSPSAWSVPDTDTTAADAAVLDGIRERRFVERPLRQHDVPDAELVEPGWSTRPGNPPAARCRSDRRGSRRRCPPPRRQSRPCCWRTGWRPNRPPTTRSRCSPADRHAAESCDADRAGAARSGRCLRRSADRRRRGWLSPSSVRLRRSRWRACASWARCPSRRSCSRRRRRRR
jgi:hypothetical protein